MKQIMFIARKEFSDGLRNRWMLAISILFAVLAVGISWFGAAAAGQVGFTSIPATIASLASLATFLMPLIALLLAYDAIVGEEEGGTLMLLLTYPLSRSELLLGKFVGHGAILGLATLLGFGSAAVAIAILVPDVAFTTLAFAFGRFILSSTLLGLVFLAFAYLLSSQAREKSTAAGLALGIWFLFVLVFDLALLTLLVVTEGKVSPELVPWLLLLNPTDIYRLLNLGGFDTGGQGLGTMSLAAELPVGQLALWACLLVWTGVILVLAHWRLSKRAA